MTISYGGEWIYVLHGKNVSTMKFEKKNNLSFVRKLIYRLQSAILESVHFSQLIHDIHDKDDIIFNVGYQCYLLEGTFGDAHFQLYSTTNLCWRICHTTSWSPLEVI